MAAGSTFPPVEAVSVEEYPATSYKPACDYLDGVLRQKPLPTRKHGVLQGRFIQLISTGFPDFEAASEVTVQLRPGKYFVPDVIVQSRASIRDPYPTEPVHLCIEILSPDDRMSEALGKGEEYHAWGVPTVWIADPDCERAWEYRAGQRPAEIAAGGSLTADGIEIPLSEAFSVLHAR
jgi:Uma2 family endonuclease